jgi:hypothetical protein
MAKNVKEHFKISDREWNRLNQEVKVRKIQEYNQMRRNQTIERFKNRNDDYRSDIKEDQYGTKYLRKGRVKRNLEKAGYDIKRVRDK